MTAKTQMAKMVIGSGFVFGDSQAMLIHLKNEAGNLIGEVTMNPENFAAALLGEEVNVLFTVTSNFKGEKI